MSIAESRSLARAHLGLTLFLAATLASSLVGALHQASAGNVATAVTWLIDGTLLCWALWTTRAWVRALRSGQPQMLPRLQRQADRAWFWFPSCSLLSPSLILASHRFPGVEAQTRVQSDFLFYGLVGLVISALLTRAFRHWLGDATRALTGEQPGLSAGRTRALLRWLTLVQLVQALSLFDVFTLLHTPAPPTFLRGLSAALIGLVALLGLLTAAWVKGAVAVLSTLHPTLRLVDPDEGGPAPTRPRPSRAHKVWIALGLTTTAALLALVGLGWWVERTAHAATLGLERGVTPQGQHFYGRADAPVTVTEYADFQCPGCQAFATLDRAAFLKDELRAGQVRVVFADFPLPFHAHAEDAAVAARCAGEEGKFWEYHDELFAQQDTWARADVPVTTFVKLAGRLNLPLEAFRECLLSEAPRQFVRTSTRQAEALKLPGTPSFTVNGQPVPWAEEGAVGDSLEKVRRAVREALDKG